MKIAIIGAGFTGLSAAFRLQQHGHDITIFEKDAAPGGLAIGYQEKEWDWSLEKHYHHWFTNDTNILTLAKDIEHEVLIKRPHTNWLVNGKIYPFDSIKAALSFPLLSPLQRLRQLMGLGLLRINPYWLPLEKLNAHAFLPYLLGKKAYHILWEPLFHNKFGDFAKNVSLAWFWARIKKRTQSLAYPKGGFLHFAQALVKIIEEKKGTVFFQTEILTLEDSNHPTVTFLHNGKKESREFDFVIVTTPSSLFLKIASQLPTTYKNKLIKLQSLGATNVVLRLRKKFFNDNTYWLSISDKTSPIMAVVEHTNFMDKKHYNNEHLVYLGNYLAIADPLFAKDKEELLALYDPFLKKINPDYKKSLIDYALFRAPFAQPVIPTNYSKIIPPMITPFPHVYLANIEQVYPWDRGTNYAVALGEKVAKLILKNHEV